MPPAHGPVSRIAALIDGWVVVSARVSRWPGAWILLHRVLSLPLLARSPAAEVSAGAIRMHRLGRPQRFDGFVEAGTVEARSGARWLTALAPNAIRDADVEAREIHPWAAGRFRRAGWTVLPEFVRYRARVAALPPARPTKSLVSDLRAIDRLDYAVSVAPRARGAWRRFRRGMSEPYARRRFGERAWFPPRPTWTRLRLHGRLVTVRRDGAPVAGGVVVRARDELWFAALGVRDGDPELLRDKALSATYRAVCELARSEGAAVLDTGRCSGRTDDPVGRYKAKWGLSPSPDPLTPLVAVRPATPAGAAWLRSLPRYALVGDRELVPPLATRSRVAVSSP